jgi:hypothetical protein
MAMESHLSELNEKHKHLDCVISEALQHPSVDTLQVTELKREKLRIKEEMERLRQTTGH